MSPLFSTGLDLERNSQLNQGFVLWAANLLAGYDFRRRLPCSCRSQARFIGRKKWQRMKRKNAHPPCSCAAKSGKYCSVQYEAMESTPDVDCRCGHPGCKGKTH